MRSNLNNIKWCLKAKKKRYYSANKSCKTPRKRIKNYDNSILRANNVARKYKKRSKIFKNKLNLYRMKMIKYTKYFNKKDPESKVFRNK